MQSRKNIANVPGKDNTGSPNGCAGGEGDADYVDLTLIVRAVIKRRKALLLAIAAAMAIGGILALVLPKVYLARLVLLPPELQQDSQFTQLLENTPYFALALPHNINTSELFIEILRSRTVAEKVLQTPVPGATPVKTLADYWGVSSMEKALDRLWRRTRFATTDQGMIIVEVEMHRPEMAAAVANAFASALDAVNREKSLSRAKATRAYIEKQLHEADSRLQVAADSLARFQAAHRAIALEDQTRSIFEQAGEVKGRIIAKEVELQLMRKYMQPQNPLLQVAESELAALKSQFAGMQQGAYAAPDSTQSQLLPPVTQLPRVSRRLADLLRNYKAQETVWQFLTQQYHRTRIQEARDTPSVQVLDPAVAPETPIWPRPLLLVSAVGVIAALLGGIVAVIAEVAHRYSHAAAHRKSWQNVEANS